MKNDISDKDCTKARKSKKADNIEFSVAFNKNGDSFQNIMEKILISKLENSTNN